MKFVANSFFAAVVSFALVFLSGCGQNNATGLDIAANSDPLPRLGSVFPTGTGTLVQGYTASHPYWSFTAVGFSGGNYLAPATGVVSEIGVTSTSDLSNVTYVTIIHSGMLASRVYGMQSVLLRSGDTVAQSQIIGTYVNSGNIGFQVLLRGSPECPLSFLTSSFRQTLNAFTGFSNICL